MEHTTMSTPPEVLGVATITALRRSDRRNFTTGPGSAFNNGSVTTVEVIAGKVDGPKRQGALIASRISEAHLAALKATPYLSVEFKEGERAPEPAAPEDVQVLLLREVLALRESQATRDVQHAEDMAALRAEVAALKVPPPVSVSSVFLPVAPSELQGVLTTSPPPEDPVIVPAAKVEAAPPVKMATTAKPSAKPSSAKAAPLPSDSPAAPVPSSGPAPK
jgi:hypothetical protein